MSFAFHANAKDRQRAGKAIGKVSTIDNLIVLELDDGVLGKARLFDLQGRTLRFTLGKTGYRGERLPLDWDSDSGTELKGPAVTLQKIRIPFSGKQWDSLSVGANGSIRFGLRMPVEALMRYQPKPRAAFRMLKRQFGQPFYR